MYTIKNFGFGFHQTVAINQPYPSLICVTFNVDRNLNQVLGYLPKSSNLSAFSKHLI